jgi:hypothetical protein
MMRPLADAAAPQDGAIAFKGLLPREAAAIAIVADAVTAAREALRLAQRAAPGQQVVIFDLLGDNSPLAELVPDDDPHGISDAVRYGLSLRALARPVRSLRRVYVVRGGQESPFDAEVLGSRIWEVWREQIRRGAGLMLVALRSDAGGTASLLERLDGVVLPRGVPRPSERVHVVGHVGQVELEPRRSQARPAHVPKKRVSTWRWPVAVFVLVAVGGTLIAVWRAGMWPFGSRLPGGTSVQPGALGTTAASQPTEPSLPASWSVELANANSLPAAIRRSLELADSLPAVTVGIGAESSSGAWYRILAGAFLTSSAADSLAWSLQERLLVLEWCRRRSRGCWRREFRQILSRYVCRGGGPWASQRTPSGAALGLLSTSELSSHSRRGPRCRLSSTVSTSARFSLRESGANLRCDSQDWNCTDSSHLRIEQSYVSTKA